jgi:hypothetical protein
MKVTKKHLLKESASYYNFKFKGKSFKAKFDTNINPTKKGIKIQFLPLIDNNTRDTNLTKTQQDELANELQVLLNQRLSKYNMNIDRDLDVPDEDVIGFLLKLNTISDFLVMAFKEK